MSIYSVSDINNVIGIQLEGKTELTDISIEGEISNLRLSGYNRYLCLKDRNSQLNCIVWGYIYKKINIDIKDGDLITCHGSIRLYKKTGQYSFHIDRYLVKGDQGDLYKEYELLNKKYVEEGLYERPKKKIKLYNERIGIATSLHGAALQDILSILKDKNIPLTVIVRDCRVQGDNCSNSVTNAIKDLERYSDITPLDVIIVSRGGGSLEDLWGFSLEGIVNTISNSNIPIITGIGHEIDNPLCDKVSDLKAITPSVAAKICTVSKERLQNNLTIKRRDILLNINNKISPNKKRYDDLRYRLLKLISEFKEDTDILLEYKERFTRLIRKKIESYKDRCELMNSKILFLDPKNIMKRGFVVLKTTDDKVIRSKEELKNIKNIKIEIQFHDGSIILKL
jgi:exodeoxyribonuclease VII large subunit